MPTVCSESPLKLQLQDEDYQRPWRPCQPKALNLSCYADALVSHGDRVLGIPNPDQVVD